MRQIADPARQPRPDSRVSRKAPMHPRGSLAAAVFAPISLAITLASSPAWAQVPPQKRPIRWDPGIDTAVTVGGAAAWLASELLKGDLAPSHCRWCAANAVDAETRRALVWQDADAAARLSNVTGFLLVPLAAIGFDAMAAAHEGAIGNVPEDVLLTAEAGVLAADVDQLTKLLVGRERPFVHALAPDEKLQTASPADNNVSFYSGHTTETFALAAASGTIGELHGYRWAPVAWGVGGALAGVTAYLRIAADKHWLTDVLVGAVVGIGIGVGVPCLFHPALGEPAPSPVTNANVLRVPAPPAVPTLSFAW